MLGLIAGFIWLLTTVFGYQQFGMKTVLVGLVLAYSGAFAYAWRKRADRKGIGRRVKRSLHLKLTGAMLAVLILDGAGYALAVSHVPTSDPQLIAILQDIFVAVAILTITVGLVLPGMIAHAAIEVADAADRLVSGTLADFTRAMRALASGDLESARARFDDHQVLVTSADEVGAMATSFNVMLNETAKAAGSLDGARESLQRHRDQLEASVAEKKLHGEQQAAIAALGRMALSATDEQSFIDEAAAILDEHADMVFATFVCTPNNRELVRGSVSKTAAISLGHRSLDGVVLPLDTGGVWSRLLTTATAEVLDDAAASLALRLGQPVGQAGWITIRVKNHAFGGVIAGKRNASATFSPGDILFLETLGSVMGSALDRRRSESELEHQATHDPLTALPNRTLLRDRLVGAIQRLERTPGTVAVLFVDIDNFKVINDSLGHDRGDQLLQAMSARLQSAVRPGDVVARFGGDEFVVLCDNLSGIDEAERVGERIGALAASPFLLDGSQYVVSVSTGIAATTSATSTAGDLLRDADSAMYQAKLAGRSRFTVFADSMRKNAVHRLETEVALREAILGDQLRLHYQPSIELATRKFTAVEALVRWQHPTRGMISPADFIPIAEETGLIVPLGEWVLREACRQIQLWREQDPRLSDLRVAVNLSGRQIEEPDIDLVVSRVLVQSGLPAANLVLEITESVLMSDAQRAIQVLTRLKSLGCRLSIDDFGTGYSSLSYLKKFPVDLLKVDQSFVAGLGIDDDDAAIVKAIISLAQSLGLDTVGEGAETQQQVDMLEQFGCTKIQGYFFHRPLPPDAAFEVLAPALADLRHKPTRNRTNHSGDDAAEQSNRWFAPLGD